MTDELLTPYTLTRAEAELFELVNLAHEQHFTTTISRLGEAWTVKLADPDSSTSFEGQGMTFAKAWTSMRREGRVFRLIQGGRTDG